jgi:hypothetical protein
MVVAPDGVIAAKRGLAVAKLLGFYAVEVAGVEKRYPVD